MEDTQELSMIEIDANGLKWLVYPNGQRFRCQGYTGQTKTGYMCATDFCDEVGEAPATGPICRSIDSLREAHPCVEECGYVRVLLIAVEFGKIDAKDT